MTEIHGTSHLAAVHERILESDGVICPRCNTLLTQRYGQEAQCLACGYVLYKALSSPINQTQKGTHNRNKTKCDKGHFYSPENTLSRPDRVGRRCRACEKVYQAAYRAKAR